MKLRIPMPLFSLVEETETQLPHVRSLHLLKRADMVVGQIELPRM